MISKDSGGRSMSSWKGNLAYENIRGMLNLGYDLKLSDKFTSAINLSYNTANHNYIFLEKHADRGDYRYAHDLNFELTNNVNINDNLNLVFGGTLMSLNGEALRPELTVDKTPFPIETLENPEPYVNIPKYSELWFNGYLQANYSWKFMKLVVGGQLNKVEGVQWNFVPRAALIAQIGKNYYSKIMYSDAFREGSFFEKGATSLPSVLGNPELLPETISTFEAQLGHQGNDFTWSATYYNSEEKDLISRSVPSDSMAVVEYQGNMVSVPLYINKGRAKFHGFEFEAKKYFAEKLGLDVAISKQFSESDKGTKDFFGLPGLMIKTGINLRSSKGFNFGLYNAYYGAMGEYYHLYFRGTNYYQKCESGSRNLQFSISQFKFRYLQNIE